MRSVGRGNPHPSLPNLSPTRHQARRPNLAVMFGKSVELERKPTIIAA